MFDRSDSSRTLPELFEGRVAENPHATAVVSDDVVLSYAELNSRANQLAHKLIGDGVGPEDLVALSLPRTAWMLVAQLAVVKAGAAYLAVDPEYPEDRVALMLSDAKPRRVLTEDDVAADGYPVTNPPRRARHDNPAYVIYTSGSTGRPKGVLVSHTGIPSLVETTVGAFGLGPGDRVLQFASMSFDTSVWEWTMALLSGATLVIVPSVERLGGPLAEFVTRYEITHLTLPPSALDVAARRVRLPGWRHADRRRRGVPAGPRAAMGGHHSDVQLVRSDRDDGDATSWTCRADLGGRPCRSGTPVRGHASARARRRAAARRTMSGELYLAGAAWPAATWTGRG